MHEKIIIPDYKEKSFLQILRSLRDKIKKAENRLRQRHKTDQVSSQIFDAYTAKGNAIFVFTLYPSFTEILEKGDGNEY